MQSLLMRQCLEKSDDAALRWGEPAMLEINKARDGYAGPFGPKAWEPAGVCRDRNPFPVVFFQCFALPDDRSAQAGDAVSSQRSS